MNVSDPSDPNIKPKPVEGEYLAPDPHPASGRNWRAAGGTAVGVGLLLAKFKGLLLALFNLKYFLFAGKFGLMGLSFLTSLWFYALFWGWKFGLVFVLLLAIHEVGHLIFVRAYGLSAPGIYFVPGLGAFTNWSGGLQSAYQESVIALGGPLLGTLGSLCCLGFGFATNEPFWFAAAYVGCLLNLWNMAPFGIFDGGRITASLSPRLWIVGAVILITAAVAFHWWNPILLIIILFGIPRAVAAWRGTLDPKYYAVSPAQKRTIALAYFGLLAILTASLVVSHVAVPHRIVG